MDERKSKDTGVGMESLRPDDNVLLLSQMELREYVKCIRMNAVGGRLIPEATLVAEWTRSREALRKLLSEESGIADRPAVTRLPTELLGESEAVLQEPMLQRSLLHGPAHWAMVELDRLVVYQKRINLARVKEIQSGIPPVPETQDLFRLAVGDLTARDSVEVTQVGDGVYSFSSPRVHADIRPLEIGVLRIPLTPDLAAPGTVLALLGVAIGAPVNVMMALDVGGRILLCNGTHRSYALRELGVAHVPCLIREVASEDELDLLLGPEVARNRTLLLRSPRPPLFKDYLDDRLRKLIQASPCRSLWQVQISIHESRTRAY
jgi:hypothetical protein